MVNCLQVQFTESKAASINTEVKIFVLSLLLLMQIFCLVEMSVERDLAPVVKMIYYISQIVRAL